MGAMSFANVGCAAPVSEANSRTNDIAIVSTDVRHPAVPYVCWLLMAYSCAAPTVATHVDIFDVADQDSARSRRAGNARTHSVRLQEACTNFARLRAAP